MMFNSFRFIIFFAVLLLLLALMDRFHLESKKNIVLLITSLLFYMFFDYRCLIILIGLITVDYFLGLKIKESECYLKVGVILSVLLLAVFKYFNFFVDSFTELFNIQNTETLNIILPIGISFYVFKSIAYLMDVKRGKCEAEKSLVNLALYISYFPEVVAGPISKPKDLLEQFKEERKTVGKYITEGMQVFFFGLFKKIVVADNISVFVDEVYRAPKIYSSLTVFLCVVAYSFEIYMDFSGYSDMSIGISKMLGYDIKRNFNLPYLSKNVTEFWKRWHISLSEWLMNYIYIPLGGNRKGKIRQYFNLFLTMIIGGLWHGANWTFVLWGAVHGLALIIHKIYLKNSKKNLPEILSVLLTFIFVSLNWVLFNAGDFKNAMDVFVQLFSFSKGINFISTWALFGIVVALIGMIYMYICNDKNHFYPIQDLTTIKGLFCFFMMIGLIVGLAYTGANPFIYAAF